MSMASMVQGSLIPSNEHNNMGEGSSVFAYQPPLEYCTAVLHNMNNASGTAANGNLLTWQPTCISKACSPPLEGPFTPSPLIMNSSAQYSAQQLPLATDSDTDHDFSFMDSLIAKTLSSRSYTDLLSLNTCQISADLDMDLSLADELPLGFLQRKLGMAQFSSCNGSYGEEAAQLCSTDQQAPANMAAAATDEQCTESARQACSSYGDDIDMKASHLTRTLTFPLAARAARSASYASKSPLLLAGAPHAEINHANHMMMKHGRYSLGGKMCRQIASSSAATTTTSQHCSVGPNADGHNSNKAKDVQIKIEGSEVTQSQDHQEDSEHKGSIKGPKQSRKRGALDGTSITSVKTPRIDTPPDVVHVRARRGQATDSHSLAERVRREKISQRMKVLQEIVPGCQRVLGKAMMLDEIINYVKSLQRQVEFLSMKLAAANQVGMESWITSEVIFSPNNLEILEAMNTSQQQQLLKLEPLISSLMQ